MAVNYTSARFSAEDDNGRPLVGGRLFTYQNGTTTPAVTYKDAAATTPNTNPIILDARGEAVVYLQDAQVYRFVLQNRFGSLIWSQDDITGSITTIGFAQFIAQLLAGAGSSLIGFINAGAGAVARTVQSKLRETYSLQDVGGDRNGFAPWGNTTSFNISGVESQARENGADYRIPVLGSTQYVFPNLSFKLYCTPDSIRDRGVAMSITIDNPDGSGSEPTTQVNGFTNHSDVGRYSDRDFVGLYVQHVMLPTLHKSTASTFTGTTVVLSDMPEDKFAEVKQGVLIDVENTPFKWTGVITGVNPSTKTLTVSAWYQVNGTETIVTGTPTDGAVTRVRPNTKGWAHNANIIRTADSDATAGVGFELGLLDQVGENALYGFDAVNLGTNRALCGHQTRGKFELGFAAYEGTRYGFTSFASTETGHLDNASVTGFQSNGAAGYAFAAKTPGIAALVGLNADNSPLFSIGPTGVRHTFKEANQVMGGAAAGGALPFVNDDCLIVLAIASSAETSFFAVPLPGAVNIQRSFEITNLPTSAVPATFVGAFAGGGNLVIPPGRSCRLWSDGSTWYPLRGMT